MFQVLSYFIVRIFPFFFFLSQSILLCRLWVIDPGECIKGKTKWDQVKDFPGSNPVEMAVEEAAAVKTTAAAVKTAAAVISAATVATTTAAEVVEEAAWAVASAAEVAGTAAEERLPRLYGQQ